MSGRLVGLEEVLGVLAEGGPLSSDALARRLGISRLGARMVLIDAHAQGLVRVIGGGEWAISERGRQALALEAARELAHRRQSASGAHGRPRVASYMRRLRASASRPVWRAGVRRSYLAGRGVPLALGVLVCTASVAVANSLQGSAGWPVAASSPLRAPAHGRHTQARVAQVPPRATGDRRRDGQPLARGQRRVGCFAIRPPTAHRYLLGVRCSQRGGGTRPARAHRRHRQWRRAQPPRQTGGRPQGRCHAARGAAHPGRCLPTRRPRCKRTSSCSRPKKGR